MGIKYRKAFLAKRKSRVSVRGGGGGGGDKVTVL